MENFQLTQEKQKKTGRRKYLKNVLKYIYIFFLAKQEVLVSKEEQGKKDNTMQKYGTLKHLWEAREGNI